MYQIIGIMVLFACYFAITISIRLNYFTKATATLQIMEVLAKVEPLLDGMTFYSTEDATRGQIMYNPSNSN